MSFWRHVLVYAVGMAMGVGIDIAVLWPCHMLKVVPWLPVRLVLVVIVAAAAGHIGGLVSWRLLVGKSEVSR